MTPLPSTDEAPALDPPRRAAELQIERAAHGAWQGLACEPGLKAEALFGDGDLAPAVRISVDGAHVDLHYDPRSLAVRFSVAAGADFASPHRMIQLEGTGLHALVRTANVAGTGQAMAYVDVSVFLLTHDVALCRDAAVRLVKAVQDVRKREAAARFFV